MIRQHVSRSAALLVAVLLTAGVGGVFGEEGEAAPKVDPKADEVMRELSEYYGGLNSHSVDFSMSLSWQFKGMDIEATTIYEVALQRPNRFLMRPRRGSTGITVVCDGTSMYTYVPMMKEYTVEEALGDLEAVAGECDAGPMGLMGITLTFLISMEPYDSIMEGVSEGDYLGVAEIDGVQYHHLKFLQAGQAGQAGQGGQGGPDWEIWVQTGERPLVRRIVPDSLELKEMESEMAFDFENWQINVELPDETFRFTPPPSAQRVESLPGQGGPYALVGKPAPDFRLELLDGGQFELAAHKGKDIVILDFWSPVGGPGGVALRTFVEVAEVYRDKGVVFYGVNQRERPETIRRFLENRGFDFPVLLDKDGKVGRLYGVIVRPQTVIVGKDGTVQAVHVGLLPDLRSKLTEELEALLAGKTLAPESKSKGEGEVEEEQER